MKVQPITAKLQKEKMVGKYQTGPNTTPNGQGIEDCGCGCGGSAPKMCGKKH